MKTLFFFADHVFRFKYRDPYTPIEVEEGIIASWDLAVYEEENDKMLRDFFIMGCVTAFIFAVILAVTGAAVWLAVH